MNHLYFLLTFTLCSEILGLPKDDSAGLTGILSHVTQLESGLHSTMTALQKTLDDLQSAKAEQQATKAQLSIITSDLQATKARLSTTTSDLQATKAQLSTTTSDIQDTKQQLNTTTSDLLATKTQLSTTTSDLQPTKTQLSTTTLDLQVTKVQLSTTISELHAAQIQMNKTISDLQSEKQHSATEITSLRNQLELKTKDVSYHAYWSGVHPTSGLPVKFNNVHYNAGNGYNTATGKFTAPVTGAYIFSAQALMYSSKTDTSVIIYKSGSVVSSNYGEDPKDVNHITLPVTAITHVKQGEQVWVRATDGEDFSGYARAIYFVGALLSVD